VRAECVTPAAYPLGRVHGKRSCWTTHPAAPRWSSSSLLPVPISELLDALLRAHGPSGTEDAVMQIVRREASSFAEVSHDVHGNTIALVRGTSGARTLALHAHADEIGMIVTHVHDDGLASVGKIANWEASRAVGKRVSVLGRDGEIPGVVVRSDSSEAAPSWTDLRLDIGASGSEEALALIEPGDPIVLTGAPVELAGGRVMSKSLDNRAGVYAALEAVRRLAADPPEWNIALVVNALEEGSLLGGATVAARAVVADAAVVLEVTYAADAPGADPGAWGQARLGGGPAIFRGPTIHPALTAGLRAAADEAAITYTLEAGSVTWSDAEAVQGEGVPVALVSIPVRYMHSPNEIAQLSDIDAVSRLVEAHARSLDASISFAR
jgi:putative aminopeptidase FrvX